MTVTWADKATDDMSLLVSVMFTTLGYTSSCINEEYHTSGRIFCVQSGNEILLDSVLYALPDPVWVLHSPEYKSWDSWTMLQSVKAKGQEHRCFCLPLSDTDPFSASVCLSVLPSAPCPCSHALLRVSKRLLHFFTQFTSHSCLITSFINPSTQSMLPLYVSAGFAPPGFSCPVFTKIGRLLLFHEGSGKELLLLQYIHIPDFSISSRMEHPVHPRTERSSV